MNHFYKPYGFFRRSENQLPHNLMELIFIMIISHMSVSRPRVVQQLWNWPASSTPHSCVPILENLRRPILPCLPCFCCLRPCIGGAFILAFEFTKPSAWRCLAITALDIQPLFLSPEQILPANERAKLAIDTASLLSSLQFCNHCMWASC